MSVTIINCPEPITVNTLLSVVADLLALIVLAPFPKEDQYSNPCSIMSSVPAKMYAFIVALLLLISTAS